MAVTWTYPSSTDYEGAADANGFSMYIATRYTQNAATNTTTVTYSYMLHERLNNFSAYSCTTYLQYKTNGATSYTKSYNPSTTIQYTAMTKNSYYWMGNNDGTPAIAFASIPTSGSITSPTGTFSWTFTVNHGATGVAPTTSVNAYMDSNTNASYVPVGTTATYTMSIPSITPYYVTDVAWSATPYTVNATDTKKITPVIGTAASINTASNNTITYTYRLYVDGVLNQTTSALAAGTIPTFSEITLSSNQQHSLYVTATDSGSSTVSTTTTIYYPGNKSTPLISPSSGSTPSVRSTMYAYNPSTSSFVSAQMMTWDGSKWVFLK